MVKGSGPPLSQDTVVHAVGSVIALVGPPHWIYVARAGDERGTSSTCIAPSGSAQTNMEKCFTSSMNFALGTRCPARLVNSCGVCGRKKVSTSPFLPFVS